MDGDGEWDPAGFWESSSKTRSPSRCFASGHVVMFTETFRGDLIVNAYEMFHVKHLFCLQR